jgi:predicted acetyltransferase
VGAPDDAVEVVRASTEAELAALRRLYPLYLHDLSAYSSHYELDSEARWRPDYLEDMLPRPECHCLLIRAGGKPAGFALVTLKPFPHMAADADVRLAEFFVAQPYRRRGIGRTAALTALDSFPGTWVFEVLEGNDAALRFWRAVVPEAEERPGLGDTVFRFTR